MPQLWHLSVWPPGMNPSNATCLVSFLESLMVSLLTDSTSLLHSIQVFTHSSLSAQNASSSEVVEDTALEKWLSEVTFPYGNTKKWFICSCAKVTANWCSLNAFPMLFPSVFKQLLCIVWSKIFEEENTSFICFGSVQCLMQGVSDPLFRL